MIKDVLEGLVAAVAMGLILRDRIRYYKEDSTTKNKVLVVIGAVIFLFSLVMLVDAFL
jgi:uncharacterized membrane-anchored protein